MTDKLMLTLQDLKVLAATAERNGTRAHFPEVALQWATGATAEIVRLRHLLQRALLMADALDATKTAVVWTVDLQCGAAMLAREIRAALKQ